MNNFTFDLIVGFLIFVLPMFFIVRKYWRSRKVEEQKSNEQKKRERQEKNIRDARLFGFILVLLSFGVSLGAPLSPNLLAMPWYGKAVIFLIGAAFIAVSKYEEQKAERKNTATVPDYIVNEKSGGKYSLQSYPLRTFIFFRKYWVATLSILAIAAIGFGSWTMYEQRQASRWTCLQRIQYHPNQGGFYELEEENLDTPFFKSRNEAMDYCLSEPPPLTHETLERYRLLGL